MAANWTGTEGYHSAGYSEIHTNRSYVGGVVKQHGNLSFSRIFDSGHDDAASQPETTLKIINRAIFNRDVATGSRLIRSNYTTSGPGDSWSWRNTMPPSPPPVCYIYNVGVSCTNAQYEAILNGTAVIKDWVVVEPDGSDGVAIEA